MKPNEYTICITNFSRPDHLRRCLASVKLLPNVVVACYGAGPEHRAIIESIRPGTRCYITPEDYGENRLLMQAVVLAETKWVVILHDDDQLVPEFSKIIETVKVGRDTGFIGWDGVTEWYGKKEPNGVFPWGKIPTGVFPTGPIVDTVTQPDGGMVKSPVTMMLRKDTAMAVLSWCEEGLSEFHTRPKMMIGNEIALLFGHIKQFSEWHHVAHPLVRFGHWSGSETVKWMNGVNPELIKLYDAVRTKFGGEQFLFRHDRIKPVFVHVHTTGGYNPRKALARETWETEWRTLEKEWLVVPLCLKSEDMARTSAVLGDERKMPFVKDLIGRALGFTFRPEDVVMLTNDDVCFTAGGMAQMVAKARETGSTYAHRRTFHDRHLKPLGLESLSRVLTPGEVATGHRHNGTDAVLVTGKWWRDIGNRHLPDFVIGCEAWDTVFIMVARLSGSGWGWRDTTYHEYHGGWWEQPGNRFVNKGQIHNRRLARDILIAHGVYRGEFDSSVPRDPAYPKRPPGCDTEPDEPMAKYMGAPQKQWTAVNPIPPDTYVPPPIKKPSLVIPPPEPFVVPPPPQLDRAIVWPWKANKAQWHELLYSVRSVEKYFDDKDCQFIILGTERPSWLGYRGRVKYFDCWTYVDAVVRGTQMARKILWMNDDIMLLKPCGWKDFETAVHLGPIGKGAAEGFMEAANTWRRGLGRALLSLMQNGIENPLNFSTHTPYIYEADKAMEVFRKYGVWEKIPLETLYHNHHCTPNIPVGQFKTSKLPDDEATVLNYTDKVLEHSDFRAAIEAMFQEPSSSEDAPKRKVAFA